MLDKRIFTLDDLLACFPIKEHRRIRDAYDAKSPAILTMTQPQTNPLRFAFRERDSEAASMSKGFPQTADARRTMIAARDWWISSGRRAISTEEETYQFLAEVFLEPAAY